MPIYRLLTSLDGRIHRGEYWLGLACIAAGFGFGVYLVRLVAEPVTQLLVTLILFMMALLTSVAVNGKRFQDRGKSWKLAFLGIAVPLLAFLGGATGLPARYGVIENFSTGLVVLNTLALMWFVFELGFLPGTAGPNRYGDDPRRAGGLLGRGLLASRD